MTSTRVEIPGAVSKHPLQIATGPRSMQLEEDFTPWSELRASSKFGSGRVMGMFPQMSRAVAAQSIRTHGWVTSLSHEKHLF